MMMQPDTGVVGQQSVSRHLDPCAGDVKGNSPMLTHTRTGDPGKMAAVVRYRIYFSSVVRFSDRESIV